MNFINVSDMAGSMAKSTAAQGDYSEGNTFSFSSKYTGIFAVKSFSPSLATPCIINLKHDCKDIHYR